MRVPLHVKLMLSYLLVVGLVVLPTFIYLRTVQRAERQHELEVDMRAQLEMMARAFSEASSADEVTELVARTVRITPKRFTVIAPDGHVVAESTGKIEQLGNHRDRPEVRAALDGAGFGCDERRSATLHEVYHYCAQRFPLQGPPRGVLRLAVSASTLESADRRGQTFLNRMAALALSVAVLLSIVAAVVVVRPLRKLKEGARAFARGDFGHEIGVRSRDEMGDVVDALENLAAQLRDRLLAAGADRATLRALLDELPIGVVLYDRSRKPTVVSATARELLDLTPATESQRLMAIVREAEHAAAIERLLTDGLTCEVPLRKADGALVVRWISIFAEDGSRDLALVVSPAREASAKPRAALAPLGSEVA